MSEKISFFPGNLCLDILIEGYGTINGKVLARNESQHFNRGNIMLINCKNIVINGPILIDAAYWVLSLYNCENIVPRDS